MHIIERDCPKIKVWR